MRTPLPLTEAGAAGLSALLQRPAEAMLALDFDGVLAPIVADPHGARPHPRTIATLARLAPRLGWITVITGRPTSYVAEHGGLTDHADLSGVVVFGHYGNQRWTVATGELVTTPPTEGVLAARAELPDLLLRLGAPDVWVEDKGTALAVHTRRSADPHGTLAMLRAPLHEFAAGHALVVEPGRLVIELRQPGPDKGDTLRRHVADCKAAAVVYIGDDLGDLAAFAAVDELREDGVAGLKVCSGSVEVIEVAERADLVVDGPDGVADLLDALVDALVEAR
jgi:trehalose 6-phosphate phosphatase